jgi:hypothetical protein
MLNIFPHQGIANRNDIEVLSCSGQNGYHQENKNQQMLARMPWMKEPFTVRVGM